MFDSDATAVAPSLEARFRAVLAGAGILAHSTEAVGRAADRAAEERGPWDPTGSAADAPREAEPAADTTPGPVTLAELRARGLNLGGLADVVQAGELLADTAAGLDLVEQPDVAVTDAAVALHRQANRATSLHLRVLEQLSGRGLHLHDGAMTPGAWLRSRTHLDPGHATALLSAAQRLGDLPHLRSALADGDASWEHIRAVTTKCVPARAADIAAADEVLAELARAAEPRAVRVAVGRIIDCVDPDGSDDVDLPQGPRDPRRDLYLCRTIDGLWAIRGTLDVLTGEQLMAFLDAFSTKDDPDTPLEQQRSAAQRRHDALDAFLAKATGVPDLPTVHGRSPHILGMFDWNILAKLAGLVPDDVAVPDGPLARLRYSGPISTGLALHLLTQAAFTLVRTQGPGRVVDVGRRMRTLPTYLRDVLQLLHRRCRGPDCDRWVTWTQAHHEQRYEDGGRTDLNQSIPLCEGHHDLDDQGWTIELDPDTLAVTWTSPVGRVIVTHP